METTMAKYKCSPGILVEEIDAPFAAAAAVEYMRRNPLSHGQVMSLTVTRVGSHDDGIYFDPQECIRMSNAFTGKDEWDYLSMLD